MDTFKVLQPAFLGSVELKNRLVVPPMVTYLANPDGTVTDEYIAYAKARAEGGFGLFTVEASFVDPLGKGFTQGIGIDNDDKIPGLKRLTSAIHQAGGKISIELHHAGRETTAEITGHKIVAPSDCKVCYSDEEVHVLTIDEIHAIEQKFIEAAERAVKSGFDVIMLHGAHGYLLSQFLSPYTNKRTDEYGGSLENRLRISLNIIAGIRAKIGKYVPVVYRMSVEEGVEHSLSLQESTQAAVILKESGIDALHIVAGNYATNELIIPPYSYGIMTNKARTQAIRAAVGPDFPLTIAGRITNVIQAEELIREGIAHFVAMGRASIADPELPKRSITGDFTSVRTCLGCNDACIGRTSKAISIGCAINPLAGREAEMEKIPTPEKAKKVLVIGGGPAGMEAAYLAAKRGHTVTLCEKKALLGGQFRLAAVPPMKNTIYTYLNHMKNRLLQAGVNVRLNTVVNETIIKQEKPDYILLATGGNPIQIPFAGIDTIHSTTAQSVLENTLDDLSDTVAVIGGGMVGCETADFIASTKRKVHVIEMQAKFIAELFFTVRTQLLKSLEEKNVSLYAGSAVKRIENKCVIAEKDGREIAIGPVDSVVLALGVRPEIGLEETIKNLNIPYTKIGDSEKQGNCRHATQTALAAYQI